MANAIEIQGLVKTFGQDTVLRGVDRDFELLIELLEDACAGLLDTLV